MEQVAAMTAQLISLDRIIIVSNYRSVYSQEAIDGYAESMRVKGFLPEYAITVYALDCYSIKSHKQCYGVIAGHSRTLAARQAGLAEVWAIVKPYTSAAEIRLDQLAENLNRTNTNPVDDAHGFKDVLDNGGSISQLMVATGKSREFINTRLALLDLIPEAQELVKSGNLPLGHAAEMRRLDRNFQLIAMRYYNESDRPNGDEFRAMVNELFTKQSQCSLFDLSLFNGQPIEALLGELKIERQKTRKQLETELAAERKARQQDRAYAKAKFAEAQRKIAQLEALLAKKEPAAPSEMTNDEWLAHIRNHPHSVKYGKTA
jgi:ParB/RepB/Spo0J family partition protein